MTTSEYLSAHAAHDDFGGFDRDNTIELYIANGVDPGAIPETDAQGQRLRARRALDAEALPPHDARRPARDRRRATGK